MRRAQKFPRNLQPKVKKRKIWHHSHIFIYQILLLTSRETQVSYLY